jgi:hypothetical protein
MTLDDMLRILARKGYWITAWYPLTAQAVFECRITNTSNPRTVDQSLWGVDRYALDALAGAMTKAGLL